MPFFVILAAFLGPFSALHTRACLNVASARQKLMTFLQRLQPWAKMVDAIFYAALCALTYTSVSLLANCRTMNDGEEVSVTEFVRYNCKEGEYNPVASLLLTTSEGAVKRLFSRKNTEAILAKNEFLAFLAYTTLNICLTGVPVPSGNFTGSMLIGGLAGRIMGALVRDYWHGHTGVAVSGVYAMVGSAAMLCGFKQMAVAVVVFITGCCNDLNLIPPLMLSITVALLLNQLINERGFDEEQILRKNIPFLPPEPPKRMDRKIASELLDELPKEAILKPDEPLEVVKEALRKTKVSDFPVVRDGKICEGFTTRARLEAAVNSREMDTFATTLTSFDIQPSRSMMVGAAAVDVLASSDGEEHFGRLAAADLCRQSIDTNNLMLPVGRLAESSPHTILEHMPAPRLYAMFAKAGVRAACVLTERGAFLGIITRSGLIAATRHFQEKGDDKDEDEDDEERDDEGCRCWLMSSVR